MSIRKLFVKLAVVGLDSYIQANIKFFLSDCLSENQETRTGEWPVFTFIPYRRILELLFFVLSGHIWPNSFHCIETNLEKKYIFS